MQAQETLKATGHVKIELRDPLSQNIRIVEIPNLVVTAGKGYIASRMVGTSAGAMSHMAVGTSGTSAANGDTALGTEAARVALASSSASGGVVTYTATFPPGTGTGALVEAGILNASSAGTLLCRTTFAVVNKGASDSMTITWTVTVS